MKILSATQADNVAIELSSLQHGILSYVLLQDGIEQKLADIQKKGTLTAAEWLGYAVGAVPKLYQEGRRSIQIDERSVDACKLSESRSGDMFFNTGEFERWDRSVQQPSVFDFRRKKDNRPLIDLGNP